MAEDFLPVFTVAVLLLVSLFIVFGGLSISSENTVTTEQNTEYLTIGDFNVSWGLAETKLVSLTGTVMHGLFSETKKTIAFQTNKNYGESSLNLRIIDTNLYGKLAFYLNGKEIYNKYSYVGMYSMPFDSYLIGKDNVLEVKAESSGWKFWAPTVYVFDAELASSAGKTFYNYTFDVSSVDRLSSASLSFDMKKVRVGKMIARLNNNEIWRGTYSESINIPTDKFKTGANALEFSSEAGGEFRITNAVLGLTMKK